MIFGISDEEELVFATVSLTDSDRAKLDEFSLRVIFKNRKGRVDEI
jgi:hypothetical protein